MERLEALELLRFSSPVAQVCRPSRPRQGMTVLRLADAREAHFMLEGVRPRLKGKIVLAVEAS